MDDNMFNKWSNMSQRNRDDLEIYMEDRSYRQSEGSMKLDMCGVEDNQHEDYVTNR